MKKIISILLTLLLLVGLMPIGAFAAEEKCETFICDGVTTMVEGEYFNLSAKFGIGKGGWEGGYVHYPLTISARDNGIRITHVDAHVCYYGNLYYQVGVSSGTKVPESLGLSDASTTGDVSVIDVNCKDFSFTNGTAAIPFDKITVYYETCEEDGHFYDSDNVCVGCGLTKCEAEGHSYEQVTVYKCHDCGEEAPKGYVPEGNTGSILSDGYPEIVYGIGGIAVGFIAAMLIFRKKKVAVSSTTDDEE